MWHTDLSRAGPGLLLSDIRQGDDDVLAVVAGIAALSPDVAVLLDIDHDLDGVALRALAARLEQAGLAMPYMLAPEPNSGVQRGFDLDRDGRLAEAEDAIGWGRFAGDGGIAILSRWPVVLAQDHGALLWRDAPGAVLPRGPGGQPYFSADELSALPLFSLAGFEALVTPPNSPPLRLMTWHAAPPAFDGPEGRNRLRNAAETGFWVDRLPLAASDGPFVLLGDANLDPSRGGGDHRAIQTLLAAPELQDPAPSAWLAPLDRADTATAWWPDGPGALRVSYLLPDVRLELRDAGLTWPEGATHAMLWADLAWPPP